MSSTQPYVLLFASRLWNLGVANVIHHTSSILPPYAPEAPADTYPYPPTSLSTAIQTTSPTPTPSLSTFSPSTYVPSLECTANSTHQSETFSSFSTSLKGSATRLTRMAQSGNKVAILKLSGILVGAIVLLYWIWHLIF
jgi:hypothetical protein